MHNGAYWRHVFLDAFVKELHALQHATVHRLLPTFGDIASEADAVAQAKFDDLGRSFCESDMGDAAETAHEEGLEHYQRLTAVRQGLLNLMTAGMYQLFEQQVATFTRRQLLTIYEERDAAFVRQISAPGRIIRELKQRLDEEGIDVERLRTWKTIEELRLVANTIKHGVGRSADELFERKPLLFLTPELRPTEIHGMEDSNQQLLLPKARQTPRVDRPLGGEDLYITAADLSDYTEAVVQFWRDLGDAITAG